MLHCRGGALLRLPSPGLDALGGIHKDCAYEVAPSGPCNGHAGGGSRADLGPFHDARDAVDLDRPGMMAVVVRDAHHRRRLGGPVASRGCGRPAYRAVEPARAPALEQQRRAGAQARRLAVAGVAEAGEGRNDRIAADRRGQPGVGRAGACRARGGGMLADGGERMRAARADIARAAGASAAQGVGAVACGHPSPDARGRAWPRPARARAGSSPEEP